MLLTSGACAGHKKEFASIFTRTLRPNTQFTHLLFNPSPSHSVSLPARGFTTLAVFKSRTKVPPKKVILILMFFSERGIDGI